jgi:hypothetical protein
MTSGGNVQKIIALLSSILLLGFSFTTFANSAHGGSHMNMSAQEIRIRILFNNEAVIVVLFNNPVSRDFVSLLPLTATFEDYARAEKITSLPRKLATQGGITNGSVQGDFAYYAPWGNLAVFYKGFGNGSNLYLLGRIESGKEKLATMSGNFDARMEIVE